MLFPSIADYKQAVMIPDSFASLTHLTPVMGQLGDVYFSSGNFAVVFKMKDTRTGHFKALKCFTRPQERRIESLVAISAHLARVASPYIVPYQFLENEIWVNDAEYPVVLMDWVEGMTLGEKVKALCEAQNTGGVHRLSVAFAGLAVDLLAQNWAHGDLKHDNIIVRPDDSLALVDYDGCFVPSMAGQMAREIGSPCYRHPKRTMEHFDRHIDNFSILVVFLSLRALAQAPHWFQAYQNGENLVLSVQDLAEPQQSPLLTQLRQSEDSYLKAALGLFEFAVAMRSGAIFGLNEGLLVEFFGKFKHDILSKTVVLRCVNDEDKIVAFEVDRDSKELNLQWKRLKSLPPEIGQLSNLTVLNLSANRLTSLPPEIGRLTNLTTLDLRYNQLTSLPLEIGQLSNLTTLNLYDNKLTSLPSEIGQLSNLTLLHLSYNQLTLIPSEIGQLSNLTLLDLSGNQLTSIPIEIRQLSNLTTLYLGYNQLTFIPSEIGQLSNLTLLLLTENELTSIPSEIGQLTNLTLLCLSRNLLTSIPSEIGQLSNLTGLHLEGNQLMSIPSEIGQLSNLEKLDLSNNQLISLPSEIGQLKNLKKLYLEGNAITELPLEIEQLTELKVFDMKHLPYLSKTVILRCVNDGDEIVVFEVNRDCKILNLGIQNLKILPSEIGKLTNLIELHLHENHLTSIPSDIWQLKKLKKLYLKGNPIIELPLEIKELTELEDFDMKHLSYLSKTIVLRCVNDEDEIVVFEVNRNIKVLDLNKKWLKSLPLEIGQLTNLTELNLSGNVLTSIPSEIGQLTNLTKLDLGSNELTSLPTEIGQLTNLTLLRLNSNQLTSIPSEIGQLTNLTLLWLSVNQLTSVPSEIGQLTNLTKLSLCGNVLTSIPSEIGQLTNLTELDLHDNQLTSIPSEIGQLANLTKLFLHKNQFTLIPPEIGQLTNLTQLKLPGYNVFAHEKYKKLRSLLPNCVIY